MRSRRGFLRDNATPHGEPVLFSYRLILLVVVALLAGSASGCTAQAHFSDHITFTALPREAQETLALIKSGGPFPYRKDGAVFGNFERRLPTQLRGYYREYTVPTPGAKGRGARRIVAGLGSAGDVRYSGEYYYTDNHYLSFRKIRE